jgi:hypothetical protein
VLTPSVRHYPLLVDSLDFVQQPRDLFGRYFLAAERLAAARGVTLHRTPFQELARLYEAHADSWNNLTPVFDARDSVIPDESAVCVVGYDRRGEPTNAVASRLYDLGSRTLKDSFEDLSFWYGDRAPDYRGRVHCSITAPTAARITGRLLYVGAFWLRRDMRGTEFGVATQWLARFWGLSRWNFDHVLSVGAMAFTDPAIQRRYGYEVQEPAFAIEKDGKALLRGVFVSATRASVERDLAEHTGVLEAHVRSMQVRRDEQVRALDGSAKRQA